MKKILFYLLCAGTILSPRFTYAENNLVYKHVTQPAKPKPAAANKRSWKIIPVVGRPAAEMKKIVQNLLSPSGTVTVDDRSNALIVFDNPQSIRIIESLLDSVDQAIKNVTVRLRYLEISTADIRKLSAMWSYNGKNVSLIIGAPNGAVGVLSGGIVKDEFKGELSATLRNIQKSRDVSSFITVMSGNEGVLHVGADIPRDILTYIYPRRHNTLITQEVEYSFVGFDFKVKPRVLSGDLIEIDVEPYLSERGEDTRAIISSSASTRITVKPGQPVVISSYGGDKRRNEEEPFSGNRTTTSKEILMILTAEIKDASGKTVNEELKKFPLIRERFHNIQH